MILSQLPTTTGKQLGDWIVVVVGICIAINTVWKLVEKIRGNPVRREEFESEQRRITDFRNLIESRLHVLEVNQSTSEKLDRKMDDILKAFNKRRDHD